MWKNVNINRQNIKAETGRAVLIQMPHNSNYDGFVFWHPVKCVRSGRNSNSVSIGYTDDFKFSLKKYGKGKYNQKDIISEVEIDAKEFEEEFDVMDKNITAPIHKNEYETHKPVEIEAKEVKVLDELKDE